MLTMDAPKSFLKKGFLIRITLFILLFSIAFLNIYKPFSETLWLSIIKKESILPSILFFIICLALILASKFLLVHHQRSRVLSMRALILWLFVEFVVIAAIYIAFTFMFGYNVTGAGPTLLAKTTYCVALILTIPYSIAILIGFNEDRNEEISMLTQRLASITPAPDAELIDFRDHTGVLRISLKLDDICYIESQDNYVNIHYMSTGKLAHYLLRCSTTELENILNGSSVMRCHRSYLVNVNRITMLRHAKGRADIVLSDVEKEIPVSRSYYRSLLEATTPDKQVRRT